jgi:hypothetical protein
MGLFLSHTTRTRSDEGKRLLTFVRSSFLALFVGQTLNHDHTAWMSFEQIVDERDEHDDGRRGSSESQAREAFDEGSHQSCRQETGLSAHTERKHSRRAQECIEKSEEPRTILDVKNVPIEQAVQALVEIRIITVISSVPNTRI